MRKIRIGSRGSKLAVWQTNFVAEKLKSLNSNMEIEVILVKTKGDKLLDVALSKIGDKGLFTKEIENEILSGRIDMAVHSMKDMPTAIPAGLTIGAVLPRENPSDVLLSTTGATLSQMPSGAVIGTSSLRRRAHLMMGRPDLEIVDMRGNIDSRIRRLLDGEADAIILAAAGVVRLGYQDLISEELDFLPAIGQGAIMVETRENDPEILALVKGLDHAPTRQAITAERSFLAALQGGCQIPIGALAMISGDNLELEGLVASLNGGKCIRSRIEGPSEHGDELGLKLAEMLLSKGAGEILAEIRDQGNVYE
ncbi:MAG: hydroxymethylbilane synthase [Syntrophomonadaceae bacterium]|nr:hydroxymethylbilane synthase [Syntrophomonadaceae bacterium]